MQTCGLSIFARVLLSKPRKYFCDASLLMAGSVRSNFLPVDFTGSCVRLTHTRSILSTKTSCAVSSCYFRFTCTSL